VYSAKHSSPISLTIGLAEMFSAVSRADTSPPRRRLKSFSYLMGSDPFRLRSSMPQ